MRLVLQGRGEYDLPERPPEDRRLVIERTQVPLRCRNRVTSQGPRQVNHPTSMLKETQNSKMNQEMNGITAARRQLAEAAVAQL